MNGWHSKICLPHIFSRKLQRRISSEIDYSNDRHVNSKIQWKILFSICSYGIIMTVNRERIFFYYGNMDTHDSQCGANGWFSAPSQSILLVGWKKIDKKTQNTLKTCCGLIRSNYINFDTWWNGFHELSSISTPCMCAMCTCVCFEYLTWLDRTE